MMRKLRGFKIGRKVRLVSTWIFRRTRSRAQYNRLDQPTDCKVKPLSKLLSWGRRLIAAKSNRSGYVRLGQEHVRDEKPAVHVPKGHMAVYVGQKDDDDFRRVLVPVIYVNHPLFSELLREAEEEYGFNQQGGITIPCRLDEFERVRSRIKETGRCSGGKPATSRRLHHDHCRLCRECIGKEKENSAAPRRLATSGVLINRQDSIMIVENPWIDIN